MPNMRGALLSPRHVLAAAEPLRAVEAVPAEFARVPKHISYWGNNQYGDCVSAEEAYAKVADNPNVFISDAELIAFARKHNWLNGAYLSEVLDAMHSQGIDSGGKNYKDGDKKSVDWTNKEALKSAIFLGTVKIAVAADQLENAGAGNKNGWFGHGFGRDNNIDHCVSLTGYGTLAYLFGQLGVPVPGGATPGDFGYLLFTWNSIGVVDERSMLAITDEAWVRVPTTPGFDPPGPPDPPTPNPPGPNPVPPGPGPAPIWSQILTLVVADIGAGKSWQDIVKDIVILFTK